MQNNNLVKRESFNEIPPRVDYTLTKEGNELRHAILSKKGSVIAHGSCSLIEKGKKIDRVNVIQKKFNSVSNMWIVNFSFTS